MRTNSVKQGSSGFAVTAAKHDPIRKTILASVTPQRVRRLK